MEFWHAISLLAFYTFYIWCLGGLVFSKIEGEECPESKTPNPVPRQSVFTDLHYCNGKWNVHNASFFAFTAITTIGYGRLAPTTQAGRGYSIFYCLLGIPLNAIVVLNISLAFRQIFRRIYLAMNQEKTTRRTFFAKIIQLVVLSVIFLSIFILLPAVMFIYVEKGWTYLDALYFAFMSLSTVGFGDIEAKKEGSGKTQAQKVGWEILTMIWILLGLGFLFMVFTIATELYFEFARTAVRRLSPKTREVTRHAVEKAVDGWYERNSTSLSSDREILESTSDTLSTLNRSKTIENVTEIVEDVMKQRKIAEAEKKETLLDYLPSIPSIRKTGFSWHTKPSDLEGAEDRSTSAPT